MEARLTKIFRLLKDDTKNVLAEVPTMRLLCEMSREEAERLYFYIDEAYTRDRSTKLKIMLPGVSKFTKVTNMEILMGMGRGEGDTTEVRKPEKMFQQTPDGYLFASTEAIVYFISQLQEYIEDKVREEISKGGSL